MKSIEVVAAIIKKDDKYLATQRGYGEFINMWEFPGGKIEPGETREEALKREIMEELNVKIKPYKYLQTIEYTYPQFHLTMHCYLCKTNEKVELIEHKDAKWLDSKSLKDVTWLPADLEIINNMTDDK